MQKIIVILICVVLTGCATISNHPGMVYFELEPSCNHQINSTVDFNQYNTFSIAKSKNSTSGINLIAEQQMAFMIQNILEYSGYQYYSEAFPKLPERKPRDLLAERAPKDLLSRVAPLESSDLVIIPQYSNEYKSIYVPPSNYTIPWRIPGQTQTTYINTNTSFSGSIDLRNYSGSGSQWGTATTKTPDTYVPMTLTSPGGYEGYFFPFIQILVYDRKTESLVWSGTICNATKEPDIRLSAQVLLGNLFYGKDPEANFPPNLKRIEKKKKGNGVFGLMGTPITPDGNNFYIRIDSVVLNSPANKRNLKPGDLIISIDHQTTLNWSFDKFLETLDRDPGQSLELTIRRGKKVFETTLVAEDERTARKNRKGILTLDEQGRIRKSRLISN